MKILNHLLFALALLAFGSAGKAHAQAADPVVLLSGIIVSGDSAYGIAGVHVYVRKASVGTISNGAGLFRLSVVPGDTIEFSHIAYHKQRFVVPPTEELAMSVLIDLKSDNVMLPVVEIFPYPTEEIFKEAFLALDLTDKREENMQKTMNKEAMDRMVKNIGMDGGGNHRYYMEQQVNQVHNQFFAPTFSLLDPFAWSKFIQSVKRGDLKKK
jgi:CarboxypepD_reg-like domain